jgi:type III pantothenate kinase
MFLAVDVGNTQTTLGLLDGETVVREWRLGTRHASSADEWEMLLIALPGMRALAEKPWSGTAVCSVVPPVNRSLLRALASAFRPEPMLLHPMMDLGVRNTYDNPMEVGMDRLVNAVEGVARYGPPLVVVDFGTATTLDIVNAAGEYLGGVILPGPEATADALHKRTAKLPAVSVERPRAAIGRSTVQAILSGIYFGAVDAVEGSIRRIEEELECRMTVVATGGLARVLGPDMRRVDAIDPELTLRGIRRVWERNRG